MSVVEERWTKDHHGLYLDGKRFYPEIQLSCHEIRPQSNAVRIDLPASIHSDLNWKEAKEQAQRVVKEGKWILWNLDLGLSALSFLPDDPAPFQALWLSLEHFCHHILPEWDAHTLGVIVYEGSLDVTPLFPRQWWQELSGSSYELFAMQLFSEYVHRLISLLPVRIFPFLLFDPIETTSLAQVTHLLLHHRFQHLVLGLKGDFSEWPTLRWKGDRLWQEEEVRANRAILLPEDPFWTPSFHRAFEALVLTLRQKNKRFCLISCAKLHEEWDGIDEIYLPCAESVSSQTVRRLQGFESAGGIVKS